MTLSNNKKKSNKALILGNNNVSLNTGSLIVRNVPY